MLKLAVSGVINEVASTPALRCSSAYDGLSRKEKFRGQIVPKSPGIHRKTVATTPSVRAFVRCDAVKFGAQNVPH